MNSVKSVSDNFEFLCDNVKKDVLLYGDSRVDRNKNKVICEAPLMYIKNVKDFLDSFLNRYFLINNTFA